MVTQVEIGYAILSALITFFIYFLIRPVSPRRMGTIGITGLEGAPGFAGPRGPVGVTTIGLQGVQGPQGSVEGISGSQGSQGGPGLQGSQGIQGPQAAEAPQGPQGTQGDSGNQGSPGINGLQGSQGPQGPQGSSGLQGLLGNQGNQGSLPFVAFASLYTIAPQVIAGCTVADDTRVMVWETNPVAVEIIWDGNQNLMLPRTGAYSSAYTVIGASGDWGGFRVEKSGDGGGSWLTVPGTQGFDISIFPNIHNEQSFPAVGGDLIRLSNNAMKDFTTFDVNGTTGLPALPFCDDAVNGTWDVMFLG